MSKRHFTFLLLPHRGGLAQSFLISKKSVLLIVLLLLAGFTLMFHNFPDYALLTRKFFLLKHAREKNRQLRTQIQEAKKKNDQLFGSLVAIDQKEKDIVQRAIVPVLFPEPAVSHRTEELSFDNIQDCITRIYDIRSFYDSLISAIQKQPDRLEYLPSIYPVPRDSCYIYAFFGPRKDPFTGNYSTHLGVDFSARTDTPVYAAAAGVVSQVKNDRFFGIMVILDHGNGLQTVYSHVRRSLVGRLQRVKKGQEIATVGSTGMAIGPHLHYEVRKGQEALDPELFFLSPFTVGTIAPVPDKKMD